MNAALVISRIMEREERGELRANECAKFMKAVLEQVAPLLPEIARRALDIGTKYWNGELGEAELTQARGRLALRRDRASAKEKAALGALMCYLSPDTLAPNDAADTIAHFVKYIERIHGDCDYSSAWRAAFHGE
jgi:hypothetical protein